MKPVALVTSLPRSRTAWLAVWLTSGSVLCLHDTTHYPNGSNDRQIAFSGPEVVELFTHYSYIPKLIVWRTTEGAFESFYRIAEKNGLSREVVAEFWQNRLHQLQEASNLPNVKTVQFESLDDETVARSVWEHLRRDEPFDVERWRMLSKLNIQQITDKEAA